LEDVEMKNKIAFFAIALIVLAGAFIIFSGEEARGITAEYYKSISCGCCDVHARYIDSKGFDTKINNLQDVSAIKSEYNIPSELQSCHTAVIGDYFVEGHIPIEAIDKLLEEQPDIAGIAMPGMPQGSPGMPGTKMQDFTIYSVNHDGTYKEFMRI